MQVFYALPFVLLSLVTFLLFLVIPRFRKYALRALVVPAAFGGLSIVFLLLGAILGDAVVEHLRLGGVQVIAVALEITLYISGGALGAWLAVKVVRRFEEGLLKAPHARELAIRLVIGLIVFGLVSFVSMGVAEGFDTGSDSVREFLVMAAASLLVGLSAGTLAYLLAKRIQGRALVSREPSNAQ